MSNKFTDEVLTAYLDGECASDLATEISKALKSDVTLNERLDALSIDKDSLKKAFQAIHLPSASIETLPLPAKRTPVFDVPFAQLAAGIVVGVAIGAGAMFYSTSTDTRDWKDLVASYQALYTTETLQFVNQSETELGVELARVSAALDMNIDLEGLQSFSPLRYKRAQILSFRNKPVIQLAFLGADGKAFALCITKSKDASDAALNHLTLEGLAAGVWSRDGYKYLLIGGQDNAVISRAAKQFQNRI